MKDDQTRQSFSDLCARAEQRVGRKLSMQRRKFAYAFVRCGGNQTKAALAAGASPKRAHVTGSEMARDEGVQALIDEISAEVMDISSLTPEVIIKLLLKEYQTAKYSRDRKAILELLGKHLGMFREQHDHRHLHAHMSEAELFKDIAGTFGLEAVKHAAKDLGYTSPEIKRLIETIKTPSRAE